MKKSTILLSIFIILSHQTFAQNYVPPCFTTGGTQCETYGEPAGCDDEMFINNSCQDLTIILHTDAFGSETSWSLTDLNTNAVLFDIPLGSLSGDTKTIYEECVDPSHCYEFVIHDSAGNGICCEFGKGGYKILLDGSVVADANANEDPFTGASREEHFGWGCTAPSGPPSSTVESKTSEKRVHTLTAYPNPTFGQTTFEFSLAESSLATLEIFGGNGKRLALLFDGIAQPGQLYAIEWDAEKLPSGMYFYRLTTDGGVFNDRLVLIK